jgi:hypothetical protein
MFSAHSGSRACQGTLDIGSDSPCLLTFCLKPIGIVQKVQFANNIARVYFLSSVVKIYMELFMLRACQSLAEVFEGGLHLLLCVQQVRLVGDRCVLFESLG